MPLAASTIKRAVDASGDDIRTFDDGGVEVQATALVGNGGEHIGIPAAPLVITDQAATFDGTGGAAENQRVALNVPGSLFEVNVVLLGSVAADRWIHIHDLAAAVVGGEVPVDRVAIPAGIQQGTRTYRMAGRPFATGIVIALSTTEATTTLPGAEGFIHSEFI